MTDFDYYTQFKFSQKEIDMLEYYIGTTPTDLNDLNRNRIPDKYKELNLTTKIQAYEKKLLEQTNIYYNKAKQLIDDAITAKTGLPETDPWKTIIENTY